MPELLLNDYGMPAILDENGAVLHADFTKTGLATHIQPPSDVTAGAPYRSRYGNPYLFNGRRWDGELGLYYYRNRHLDPIQGRFTTRDPIGNWGDGMNLGNGYGYVGNNPWTYVDPFGLEGGSYILSHTPLQDGNSSGWNDPMSMLNGLDSAGYSSGRQLSAAGHQELANTMVNASGVYTAIVAGTIGVNGRTNEASEWQQMGTVIGAEARNEAIGTVTGAGATAVGVGIYQRYFRRPVGNLLSSAWGRVCSLVGRGADDVAGFVSDTARVEAGVGRSAWVSPADLRFSQRTVTENNYLDVMEAGDWRWSHDNPLVVMERPDGTLVSLDNRRLAAARQASNVDSVPVRILKPNDTYYDYSVWRTAEEAFQYRSTHLNTLRYGGEIPPVGLNDLPIVLPKN